MKHLIGKKVEFTASRIFQGNPIKGTVKDAYGEWIDVELNHSIEGINTIWRKGETKAFRLSLISGEIKEIQSL